MVMDIFRVKFTSFRWRALLNEIKKNSNFKTEVIVKKFKADQMVNLLIIKPPLSTKKRQWLQVYHGIATWFTGNRPTKRDIFLHNVFTVKRIFITIFRWTMNRTRPSLKQRLNVKTQSWIMSENITCTIWIPSYVGFGFVQSLNCTQNDIFMLEILRLPSSLHNHLYDPIHVIAYRNSIMINVVTKHGKKGDI